MHALSLIAFGFVMLLLQAAVATMVPMHGYAPNLLLAIVIYLGISGDVSMVRGASISFALGYFYDAFCGSPMGLQTFTLVASFMVARGAGLRLFPKGLIFQVLLTFIMAVLCGVTILALRAIFEPPAPFASNDAPYHVRVVLEYSAVTALLSPLVFSVVRKLDSFLLPRLGDRKASGV